MSMTIKKKKFNLGPNTFEGEIVEKIEMNIGDLLRVQHPKGTAVYMITGFNKLKDSTTIDVVEEK